MFDFNILVVYYICNPLTVRDITMKIKKLILACSLTMTACFANSASLEDGKEMYEEDCVACHDSSVFTRDSKERKVNDFATLEKQVHRCVVMTELSWFEEDEANVVEYLNTNFYKFKKD